MTSPLISVSKIPCCLNELPQGWSSMQYWIPAWRWDGLVGGTKWQRCVCVHLLVMCQAMYMYFKHLSKLNKHICEKGNQVKQYCLESDAPPRNLMVLPGVWRYYSVSDVRTVLYNSQLWVPGLLVHCSGRAAADPGSLLVDQGGTDDPCGRTLTLQMRHWRMPKDINTHFNNGN